MSAPQARRPTGSVQSVERTFDLFEALVEAGKTVTLSELSARASLPLGTTHRLLATLTARGYARQDPESRAYAVGYKVMDWATRVGANQLLEVARPPMRQLMDETGETVNLVILDRTQIVYADQVAPERLVRMFTQVGNRAPVHSSGAGKALLAFRPAAEARALMSELDLKGYTAKTITTLSRLESALAEIRAQGFAVDDGEFEEGVRCLAAPILNGDGVSVAAVSISGPASRVSPDKVAPFSVKLKRCAAKISEALGYGLREAVPPRRAKAAAKARGAR
jgi:IclR family transcriptional regulator, acetate operon repressor